MPESKRPLVVFLVLILVTGIIIVTLKQNGIVPMMVVWTAAILVACTGVYSEAKYCTEYERAWVVDIFTKGETVKLKLCYPISGVEIKTEVSYFEKMLPEIGQVVGIYYNPKKPRVCQLSIYKSHAPHWTEQTKAKAKNDSRWALGLGIFFIAIGICAETYQIIRTIDLTATTDAVVVDYYVHESHGSDGARNYSYYPIVSYEVNGQYYKSQQVTSDMIKMYDIGAAVTIRYNPEKPTDVMIEGSITGIVLLCISTVAGLALIVASTIMAKKVISQEELDELEKRGINFS